MKLLNLCCKVVKIKKKKKKKRVSKGMIWGYMGTEVAETSDLAT
jgi:hypothetical protein